MTYRMIDQRIHGVVKDSPNSSSAVPSTPNPSTNTMSDSQLKIIVDFASTDTCAPFPARTARIAVIGRIAIGPMMKTAVTTCRTLSRISMRSA